MEKEKRVVREEEWGKIITMDSIAQIGQEETGQVVVAGSHGSAPAARHAAQHLPFGLILNDAGKGKKDAGISGLPTLEAMGILGATVDCMTGRIGDGFDNYESGIISVINAKAKAAGVRVGMLVVEAASLILAAKKSVAAAREAFVIYEDEGSRIVLTDTISYLNESHRGSVVVGGSHCAETTYVFVKDLGLKGIFLNDAGKGKDSQGISGLPVYDRAGIAAAAVDSMTAIIGDARDAWESGLISAVNNLAATAGVQNGMRVQEAAKKALKAL